MATFDPKKDYFVEFWKKYIENEVLVQNYNSTMNEIKKISKKLYKLERKRYGKLGRRRPDNELGKFHECTFPNCNKRYAYDSSLWLHIKRKHKNEPSH